MDRKLVLTDQTISLIQKALGIAEKTYNDIAKEINVIGCVRNNIINDSELHQSIFDRAAAFAALNEAIDKKQFDV